MEHPLVPPSKQALAEALSLCDEVLKNLDLGDLPLSAVCLKAARLARLLNDFEMERILSLEVSGYAQPLTEDTLRLARLARRDFIDEAGNPKIHIGSVGSLEEELSLRKSQLIAAADPDYSFSTPSPLIVPNPPRNQTERVAVVAAASAARAKLDSRRAYVHEYVRSRYTELRFSGITEDIISRTRERLDRSIGSHLPESVDKLTAIYSNLQSENPEDWSNAVHGCRRLLVDLADALFPARNETRKRTVGGKEIEIKLGAQEYKNRLLAFVDDNSSSDSFTDLVGSHIRYLADRLDAICDVANIGSHTTIVRRPDADRYVIFTYLLVADILDLKA